MKIRILGGFLICPALIFADFSYTQTSRMTGGALVAMSRSMGVFSKNMRKLGEPTTSTVALQGNRMVTTDERHSNIIDLDKETITEIEFEKKTYSTITFAQMKEAMEKMMAKMQNQQADRRAAKPSDADLNFEIDIKETGQRKSINGVDAREVVMIFKTIVTDKKSGQSGAMDMLNAIWVADASAIPGHKQLEDFHKKMAMKMASAWAGMRNPMMGAPGMDPRMMAAMRKAAEEGQKLSGVHVMQISKFGTNLDPATASQISPPPPPGPTAGDAAGQAAGQAAGRAAENEAERQTVGRLGRLGGLGGAAGGLGGLGGLGRRKKKDDAPQEKPPAAEQSSQAASNAAASGTMMEMVIEMSNFSTGPVDDSKFAIPAGFTKTDHPMLKGAKE